MDLYDSELEAPNPIAYSRICKTITSDHSTQSLMAATLISFEVFEWNTSKEKKLREDLAKVSLEDHSWSLKRWDQKGAGVVVSYCVECWKDFEDNTEKHRKAAIANLLSNFKKCYMMSASHICE